MLNQQYKNRAVWEDGTNIFSYNDYYQSDWWVTRLIKLQTNHFSTISFVSYIKYVSFRVLVGRIKQGEDDALGTCTNTD